MIAPRDPMGTDRTCSEEVEQSASGLPIASSAPAGATRQGRCCASRREIVPRQSGPYVAQVGMRGCLFGGAFREIRQHVGDFRRELAKLDLRTGASARLLSALSLFPPSFFGRANRGLLTEAKATEEAGASACDRNEEEERVTLAAMQRTNGAKRPEEGRGWCGGDGEVKFALAQIRAALAAGVAPGVVLMDASYGTNSASPRWRSPMWPPSCRPSKCAPWPIRMRA
jgi:hypothetical protein